MRLRWKGYYDIRIKNGRCTRECNLMNAQWCVPNKTLQEYVKERSSFREFYPSLINLFPSYHELSSGKIILPYSLIPSWARATKLFACLIVPFRNNSVRAIPHDFFFLILDVSMVVVFFFSAFVKFMRERVLFCILLLSKIINNHHIAYTLKYTYRKRNKFGQLPRVFGARLSVLENIGTQLQRVCTTLK